MFNLSVMLGNFFAADGFSRRHFQMHLFLSASRVNERNRKMVSYETRLKSLKSKKSTQIRILMLIVIIFLLLKQTFTSKLRFVSKTGVTSTPGDRSFVVNIYR